MNLKVDEQALEKKYGKVQKLELEGDNEELALYFKPISKVKNLRSFYSRVTKFQAQDQVFEAGELVMKTLIVDEQKDFIKDTNTLAYVSAAIQCNQLLTSMSGKFSALT